MNKYTAQEQAYKNGYELGKKVKQENFAEQFIKDFNEGVKDAMQERIVTNGKIFNKSHRQ